MLVARTNLSTHELPSHLPRYERISSRETDKELYAHTGCAVGASGEGNRGMVQGADLLTSLPLQSEQRSFIRLVGLSKRYIA